MIACHLIVAVIVLGFPPWDFWEAKQLRNAAHPRAKTDFYVRAIAGLWFVALAVILCRPLPDLWPAPAGEIALLDRVPTALSRGIIFGLIFGVMLPPLLAWAHGGLRRQMLAPYEKLDYMLPNHRREMVLFGLVSISAGICEELIFRGFLLRYLQWAPWGLSLGWSLLISSALFGLAHAGQGLKGMLGTALIGLILGWLYLASGSLLIPIIVHALIDLRALAMALLRKLPAGAPSR